MVGPFLTGKDHGCCKAGGRPHGSSDSKSSEQVFTILETLVREHGKTVVAVTHDLELAARMDRRIHLVDGRIISDERQELPDRR